MWPSDKGLKIFRKWSEIVGKSSRALLSVCLYNKQNNTRLLVDKWNISPCVQLYISVNCCTILRVIQSNTQIDIMFLHVPVDIPLFESSSVVIIPSCSLVLTTFSQTV